MLRTMMIATVLVAVFSSWRATARQSDDGPFGRMETLGLAFVERTVDGVVDPNAYVDEDVGKPGGALFTLSESRASFGMGAQVNSDESSLVVYCGGITFVAQ